MKIFIDSANVEEIEQIARMGVLSGATTNPSLISKEGKDLKATILRICELVDGPVSVEVNGTKADEMVAEAAEFVKWHKNIIIKLPMTAEGLAACKQLSSKGIKTNVTLIFSPNQALLAARAGATYVSPFVGRLDDISEDGLALVSTIADIFGLHGIETEIISASIRHPAHIVGSAKAGADIATCPGKVILQSLSHPLTDKGLEIFANDWAKYQGKK